ncbi:3D domain-containing protein [Sporomusa aerivorans]|uniref:3D domain-containing protein n=1 Tax=Sporomusa aerivorans TaxID=204936 RepID=UPI00352BC44C
MRKNWRTRILALVLTCTVMLGMATEADAKKKPTYPRPDSTRTSTSKQSNAAADTNLKHLQQLLANTGFYPGAMTGVLDSTTKDAITRAQRTFKLAPTGKYDKKLAEILTREARLKPNSYRKKLSMQATAYTSQDPGCGKLTKREHPLRTGLVAVDPKIIPLGTRLYIEGYGYAVADDIGRAIKGTRIDLAYETRKEALQFGRKTVTVFVLD